MYMNFAAIRRCVGVILLSLGCAAVGFGAEPATRPSSRPAASSWGARPLLPGEANQPRVLLIGDSILNGYGSQAADLLRGKVALDAFVTPKHVGSKDLPKDLAAVFSQHTYNLVLFNDIGLHAWQPGRIPEGQYELLLRTHLATLQKLAPGAKLVFATTTPMTTKIKPFAIDAEFDPVITGRNEIAKRVMAEQGVPVVDFHALLANQTSLAAGDRFHWTKPAYAILAKAAAAEVIKQLKLSESR